MKSLIVLWKKIAEDLAIRCRTSTTMDAKYVQGRSKHEGLSFLTITLPSFGKDFQKSLDQGLVDRNTFQGFTWRAGLPQFLGGFLDLVFDRTSGVLLVDPDIDAILAVRQLTLIFSKILLPCSDAREKEAMSDYIQCEKEVKVASSNLDSLDYREFERMSQLLFRDLFIGVDREINNLELIPKHGPGATADKLRGNGKFENRTWTDRLEEFFPSGDYLFPNARYFNEHYDDVHHLEPGSEIPVKVISVPKTQKTPRIIAIEPTCMQYAQQALLDGFNRGISQSYLRNLIGTDSQEPNQLLARSGSLSGSLATLDLSEASDRVSNQLVRALFARHSLLQGAVEACRSRRADVPGHGVIRLSKFASMGSALTFPIEAMVFLTLVFLGIEKELSTRFTRLSDIIRFSGSVRVYGDDIITPVDSVHSVVHTLEHFGARVGMAKSFWIGRFRESCGKEYYSGYDVSVVKVRRILPSTRKHVPEVISTVSLRNQLYKAGHWRAVKWLDHQLVGILKYFPYVDDSSSVLGRYSFLGYDTERVCENLHRPLVKGYVVSSRLPSDPLDGSGALLKCLLKRGNEPVADSKHLERA
ncbi:RNA-directed RNA polymerase, partial [ssRNA phage Zoerhiza.2_9]